MIIFLAYYAFLSQNERIFGRSGERMMGQVGGNLAMNVLFGLMSPSIDNWAHGKDFAKVIFSFKILMPRLNLFLKVGGGIGGGE